MNELKEKEAWKTFRMSCTFTCVHPSTLFTFLHVYILNNCVYMSQVLIINAKKFAWKVNGENKNTLKKIFSSLIMHEHVDCGTLMIIDIELKRIHIMKIMHDTHKSMWKTETQLIMCIVILCKIENNNMKWWEK